MIKEWKEIDGFEGLYMISNFGEVKSMNYRGHGYEKIMAERKDKRGYVCACLSKGKKQTYIRVHRLVASAFIPNPNSLTEVNHKDENKSNNNVNNLEWCDRKYNCNYGDRTDNWIKSRSGWKHSDEAKRSFSENRRRGNHKLAKKVECDGIQYECIKDLSEAIGVKYGTITAWLNENNDVNIPLEYQKRNLKLIKE